MISEQKNSVVTRPQQGVFWVTSKGFGLPTKHPCVEEERTLQSRVLHTDACGARSILFAARRPENTEFPRPKTEPERNITERARYNLEDSSKRYYLCAIGSDIGHPLLSKARRTDYNMISNEIANGYPDNFSDGYIAMCLNGRMYIYPSVTQQSKGPYPKSLLKQSQVRWQKRCLTCWMVFWFLWKKI